MAVIGTVYKLQNILSSTSRVFNQFELMNSTSTTSVYNDSEIVFDKVKNLQDKTYCSWCHGITFDDSYGHCIACGGPREE